MPEQSISDEATAALRAEWGIEHTGGLSEAALLQLLADGIVTIMQQGSETFFQLMYRLDIPERKLNEVMTAAEAPQKIARLIYDRQIGKIKSRQQYRQDPNETDPDLKW